MITDRESTGTSTLASRARLFFGQLQDTICEALERLDGGARFGDDPWTFDGSGAPEKSGGGRTRVLERGRLFEKAGVNFSSVRSPLSAALANRLGVPPQGISATGISLVLHPESPMIPTVHMNLRHLELEDGRAWFGGGTDLTPYYFFEEDARHFHRTLREACDRHDRTYYPRFKKWCDEYFYLPHRQEARGIGGLFFDDLSGEPERTFAFVQDVGASFLSAYLPIVERRRSEPWGPGERRWQELRRGRYVEFNLLHDRGTLFGLETGGRIESILMSLPPRVRWEYLVQPQPGSREHALLEILHKPGSWA